MAPVGECGQLHYKIPLDMWVKYKATYSGVTYFTTSSVRTVRYVIFTAVLLSGLFFDTGTEFILKVIR